MDKDQVEGKFDQAIGKLKEKVGDAFGKEKLANEGVADQVKGSAKETWGNAKDAANTTADRSATETRADTHEARWNLTDSVENTKKKVNEKIDEFKDDQRRRNTA
jgi:uncharacterized protein YjbJ (UPF0337 family)